MPAYFAEGAIIMKQARELGAVPPDGRGRHG